MIGHLRGVVLFSDGLELVLATNSGVGYQIHCSVLFPEGKDVSLFISHIIKEASQELFGFTHLREKKLFELLNTVKGVGPKSAYALIQSLGFELIVQSIRTENKKTLHSAPGIGPKAAAQICLDLQKKIQRVCIYLNDYQHSENIGLIPIGDLLEDDQSFSPSQQNLLAETIMACKELGFKEVEIKSQAIKLLNEHRIERSEQLVHLILKER